MGNCSNKTDKHIYENKKYVKYQCQLCIEQNIEPLYYSKEMIEVEVITPTGKKNETKTI